MAIQPKRKRAPANPYMSASEAAAYLSEKLGRHIDPDYIRKLPDVRNVKVNATTKLYLRADIEQVYIRERKRKQAELQEKVTRVRTILCDAALPDKRKQAEPQGEVHP